GGVCVIGCVCIDGRPCRRWGHRGCRLLRGRRGGGLRDGVLALFVLFALLVLIVGCHEQHLLHRDHATLVPAERLGPFPEAFPPTRPAVLGVPPSTDSKSLR